MQENNDASRVRSTRDALVGAAVLALSFSVVFGLLAVLSGNRTIGAALREALVVGAVGFVFGSTTLLLLQRHGRG